LIICLFFFYAPAPSEISTLSLHDALPISSFSASGILDKPIFRLTGSNLILQGFVFKDISFNKSIMELSGIQNVRITNCQFHDIRSEEHTSELQSRENLVCRLLLEKKKQH